ncbi:MAG: hypothetical protein N3B21_09295 [Clostridia bacterium]|nr:hypothetical protein [Clostridia bacterium]
MKKLTIIFIFSIIILILSINSYAKTNTRTTYTNASFDYSLSVTNEVYLHSANSSNTMDDSILTFIDKTENFSGVIACDRLDSAGMEAMRQYLNDTDSTDDEIFRMFISYKESYFTSMLDSYMKDFLYGSISKNMAESNIKIFKDYSEKLFGQDSHIMLYNIIKSDSQQTSEEIHINISLPVYSNRTVYTINFTAKKGILTKELLKRMSALVNSIIILDLPPQEKPLDVFTDDTLIQLANEGIYPEPGKADTIYTVLANESAGYKITYPSNFIPYMQNNLVGEYDHKSFKINYNHSFSISVEPFLSKGSIQSKVDYIKELHGNKINITYENYIRLSEKDFFCLKYELSDRQGISYIEDYFTVTNSKQYRIKLNSRLIKPDDKIRNEFFRILDSLVFFAPIKHNSLDSEKTIKFENKEEGYSFSYPESWQLTPDVSSDINYDKYVIKHPDFSGPLDVSISEGEFNSSPSYSDILKFTTQANSAALKNLIKRYSSPCMDTRSRILSTGYYWNNGVIYIYRLVNFLDPNSRSKIGYSMDIIRNKKIYSLFVSASDYIVVDGKVFDEDLCTAINQIATSFNVETTPEYLERQAKKETRNIKVVLLENFFKLKLGETAYLTSAVNLNTTGDIIASLEGIPASGFYKVKADYAQNSFEITDSILKRDIQSSSPVQLETRYGIYTSSIGKFVSVDPNANFTEKSHTQVFFDFKESQGYCIVESDNTSGNLSIIGYTPLQVVYDKINQHYSSFDFGYEIDRIELSNDNKFEVSIRFISISEGKFWFDKLRVRYSKASGTFEAKK